MKYIRKASLIIMLIMMLYITLEHIDNLDRNLFENGVYKELNENTKVFEKKLLLSKGLNQSKIAQELGISRQAVSKLCKEI